MKKFSGIRTGQNVYRVVCLFFLLPCVAVAAPVENSSGRALLNTATLNGSVPVKTWKALRDAELVKQDLDYSCGAASVATILQSFYGLQVTETDILSGMEDDGAASFQDLAEVVKRYGLKGVGLALDFSQLKKLQVSVIAYLLHRDEDHFTVIKGISDQQVALADPSWGNRKLSIAQFMRMWNTREDDQFRGKILALLPAENKDLTLSERFFVPPERNTTPQALLTLRRF